MGPMNSRAGAVTLLGAVAAAAMAAPAPAHAELVFLTTGRTLSVQSHTIGEGRATLRLRAGGEIVCDASLISRVEPDEVPWPEPLPEPEEEAPPGTPGISPFDALIRPVAERHGVDAALVRAVIETESAFDPGARSRKGAMGLMQLMPQTARQYAVENPYDPTDNLEAGVRHLKSLLDRYDVRLALAAYNAGEATVRRYGGVPPYRETRDYVDRVLRRLEHYRRVSPPAVVPSSTQPALASPSS
jgi:hypothetical protein